MEAFLFIAVPALYAAFSLFFLSNMLFFLSGMRKIKSAYLAERVSFWEQLRFFVLVERRQVHLSMICAVIGAAAGLQIKILGDMGIILGAVAGWFVPGILIRTYRNRRLSRLNSQFVHALNLIGSGMRAGESLPQAIESSQEMLEEPIVEEFAIISRQIKLGKSIEEALTDFSGRLPLNDVRLAVKAMIISMKTGADLPVALGKISDTVRQRNNVQGKIDALTVQGKTQGVVVGLMPVVLGAFLYWRDPQGMNIMFTTLPGHLVIIVMILMEIAAFFVIRKIVTIRI